ncbi:MAG: GH25 family lysozyme, partial [Acutalibacteraceae bacterium]
MKLKKNITVFAKKALVLLLALIFIMPYVPASKVYAAYVLGTYKVTASSLTIRSGPDTTYSALGYLSNGDVVTITEIQNEKWGKFTKDGITGWSSMAYMELIEEGTSTTISVGDQITINAGATSYGTTTAFASFVYSNVYVVISISGDRVVFGPDSSSVTGAVALSDITKVGTKNYYAAGENKIYAKGIDVSKWQASINWTNVAADGVDFAILRAAVTVSPGASVGKDSYFETNYANAKAAGIDVGVYMYGCAITTDQAIAEADGLYNIIKGKQFEYPIYYDVEYEDQKTVGKTAMANVIMAFIRRMESY